MKRIRSALGALGELVAYVAWRVHRPSKLAASPSSHVSPTVEKV
jgi:hypothetical protein